MAKHRISRFSGEFISTVQEQVYLATTWPQSALHLRIAITVSMLGFFSSFYLYYLLFGTGYQFQLLCLSVIAVMVNFSVLFALTYRDSYTMPARLLSMFALILLSVNQLLGHHFLLEESQVHNKVGMPFIIVIILIFYAFVPNRTYKTVMATSLASLIFLLYYLFSPLISFSSTFMLFIELLAVNAMGYLFLINWNRLRRLEFAQRRELEDEISKRIEAEKVARAASAAKTRFLASASHDLRQPLQAQRLYVETIAVQTKEKAVRELGRKVISSQRSMQKMLDALLDLSRLDAGMMTPRFADVSLKRLFLRLEQEFSSLANNKGLQFHLHWPPDDTTVRSDPGMLESILHNLLSNALSYTDEGAIMLAARRRGSSWRLEVRDSGKGIAEKEQQMIFEEFYQLGNPERDREKGLGLGLAIVRRQVHLLEHELSLFSRPGKGSIFALSLPVGLFPATETTAAASDPESRLSSYHVLVIDDEYAIRDGIACALEFYGCSITQAAGRTDAETAIREKQPDALLVDFRLANDENGIDLINHLRDVVSAQIPALLLTGDTSPDVLPLIKQAGFPVLHKPVALNELVQALLNLLEKPAAS